MTTLKEYKAMMEGAADALNAKPVFMVGSISVVEDGVCETINQFIAASRNIAPELIRVIELAERGLINAKATLSHNNLSELIYVEEALSEIRKLKGE